MRIFCPCFLSELAADYKLCVIFGQFVASEIDDYFSNCCVGIAGKKKGQLVGCPLWFIF